MESIPFGKKQILEIGIFHKLRDEEIERLQQQVKLQHIRKGSLIFAENNRVNGLHLILTGKVKLYKAIDDGGIQILRIAKEGEVIGYRGLLGDGKYIATAEVLEEAQIAFFSKTLIFELLQENHHFAIALMNKFANDLSEMEEKTIRFVQKNSKARLADAIIMLQENFGVDAFGFINIKLTRKELGAFTGVVAETIIRTLKNWKTDKIIELNKKQIKILNLKQLRLLGQGEN
jgi:CRP-like cAMP-binding protein